ncbi:MAG: hypothetical protein IJ274_10585, partial [Lachnospiraceae bacterium]|nr:hypothetical protein [Lachnospiraceae bacterium]
MGNLKNRRAKQQMQLIGLIAILVVTLIVIVGIVISISRSNSKPADGTEAGNIISSEDLEAQREAERKAFIAEADYLALTYDYDGAIAKIKEWPGYEEDEELLSKIDHYQTDKNRCVKVDIDEVTHIFYHSLVVDPERAFDPNDYQGRGNNEW